MSVRPFTWDNSASTGGIFMNFDIWVFFSKICWENSSLIEIRQEYKRTSTWLATYIYDIVLNSS